MPNSLTRRQAGRIDIRYRTAAGKHIIIELKRYSVVVNTAELVSQLASICLRAESACAGPPDQPQAIECIASFSATSPTPPLRGSVVERGRRRASTLVS